MGDVNAKRILIVDDEITICRALSELLTMDGHHVEITCAAGDAIELCKMRHFDLIFLDYYLPEMTGEKVLSVLRRANPRQRIVLMSGQRPFPAVGQADFVIRKPFTAELIRSTVARFAGAARPAPLLGNPHPPRPA